MKRYTILISLLIIASSDTLLAFGISNIGFRIGGEPALETYFVTHSQDEIWDSREPPRWIFQRWNGRIEAFYRVHNNMDLGILFKTMTIRMMEPRKETYIFGTIGISGEYTYHWKTLSALAGFSLGTWMHLSKEEWIEQKRRFSYEIRAGIGYKLSNKISSHVYINRDFIHYKWGQGFVDTYTWFYMWSVGLSLTFHLFR